MYRLIPKDSQHTLILLASLFALGLFSLLYLQENYQYEDIQGGCEPAFAKSLQQYSVEKSRITYCQSGDAEQTILNTTYTLASGYITFLYSGYPNKDGIKVFIESKDGNTLNINLEDAKESWRFHRINLPEEFKNQKISLIAQDKSSDHAAWIGIGRVNFNLQHSFFEYINLKGLFELTAAIILAHTIFTLLLTNFLTEKNTYEAGNEFLIFLGLWGYIAFFSYYSDPYAGYTISTLMIILCLKPIIYVIRKKDLSYIRCANKLLLPATTYVFFIFIITSFPFSDNHAGLPEYISHRWRELTGDNLLPKIFADQVWNGNVLSPMSGDWLSSDRPPLQTGIYLLFYPISHGGLTYQVVCSLLQSFIFFPVLSIISKINKGLIGYIYISLGITSLLAIHISFVWPKLISASYVLIFFSAILTSTNEHIFKIRQKFIAAASISLAMLSHGSAIFAILAIYFIYITRNRLSNYKNTLTITITSIVMYTPWLLYQRFIDPPGDRLVKWHLAGIVEPNALSVRQALYQSYSQLSLKSWIKSRIDNFETIYGYENLLIHDLLSILNQPGSASLNFNNLRIIWDHSFFYTFYSFWFMSPIIACIFFLFIFPLKKTSISNNFFYLFLSGNLSAIISCILLFEPGATIIHQMSFFTWISLFLCAFLLLNSFSKIMLSLAIVGNSFVFFNIFVFDMFWQFNLNYGLIYIICMTLAFVFFVISCLSLGRLNEIGSGATAEAKLINQVR